MSRNRQTDCELTIILPCLHEADNLSVLLPELNRELTALNISGEIIVVDGNSGDGTIECCAEAGVQCIVEPQPGYGVALLRGFREARGRYILTMDADLSHPARFIRDLWGHRNLADILIASRYVKGGGAAQPWLRLLLSRLLNVVFGWLFQLGPRDLSSGFRLYRAQALRSLRPTQRNFAVLIELLFLALEKGYSVAEVPFYFEPRKTGSSHARLIAFGLEYLRLIREKWRVRRSIEFPDYDWRAHDSIIPLQRYWQRKRRRIIRDFVPPGALVCDIGCGSGRLLTDFDRPVGVDIRFDKLRFMHGRIRQGALVQGDGMALPFSDASFDVVVSSELIEHMPDENGRHIDECLRVLKPGGILVMGTPDYGGWQWPLIEWLYARVAPGAYAHEHVNPYTRDRLISALRTRACEILAEDSICRAELILKCRKDVSARPAQSRPGETAQ